MKALYVLLFLSLSVGFIPTKAHAQANEDELKEIILEGEEYSLDALT